MFSLKYAGVLTTSLVFMSSFVVACGPVEDDDSTDSTATPADESPTPSAEPVPLSFSTDDVDVQCTGTTAAADSVFNYFVYNDGEGYDTTVTVYDNSAYGYGGDTSKVWTEVFTMDLDTEYEEGGIVYAQDWVREVAEHVTDSDYQIEDENSIFNCDAPYDALTYVFCSYDVLDDTERCVGLGPEAAEQCPDCDAVADF